MSKWIDAEWLAEELGDVNMDIYTNEVKEYIDSAPSIDIVRCEECKHRKICFGRLVQGTVVVQLNFCSYGEGESRERRPYQA